MKVLVLHNSYSSQHPSGENVVVDADVAALREVGVEVLAYTPSSDDIPRLPPAQKFALVASGAVFAPGVAAVRHLVAEHRPDVVHAHNITPLISPAALHACRALGVPVVQTVHNYRMTCLAGTQMRAGRSCVSCTRRNPAPGIVRGCYRSSRAQSGALAVARAVAAKRGDPVTLYVAVSEFVRNYLVAAGIPPDRVVVKHNSVSSSAHPSRDEQFFLYAGRLSAEKGVQLLLDAWVTRPVPGHRLVVAGAGELAGLAAAVSQREGSVEFAGLLPPEHLRALVSRSTAVVIPSLCDETFGLGVAEAFAAGKPVVVTDRGALPELASLGPGFVASPTVRSLCAAMHSAARAGETLGDVALGAHRRNFSTHQGARRLLAHYTTALALP